MKIVDRKTEKLKIFKLILAYVVGAGFLLGLIYYIYSILIWRADAIATDAQIVAINKIVEKSNEIDFSKLEQTNSDTKGWITVNGTSIDYPFVQSADNNYYLSHSFDKSPNQAGWVFMDYRNQIDSLDKNTVIYAHGRVDGTMFGTMRNVLNQDWQTDTNNHIIKINTKKNETKWQVFSVYRIETTDDNIQTSFNNITEFQSFLDLISHRSIYDFKTALKENDRILTLSTCYDKTDKIVLHAKLITEQN